MNDVSCLVYKQILTDLVPVLVLCCSFVTVQISLCYKPVYVKLFISSYLFIVSFEFKCVRQ